MRKILYFIIGFLIAFNVGLRTADAAELLRMPDGSLRVIQRNLDGSATYTTIKDAAGDHVPVERSLGTKTIGAAQGARVPVTIEGIATKNLTKDLLARSAIKNLRRGAGVATAVGVVADVIGALDLHYDPTCNCIVQGTPGETVPATQGTETKPLGYLASDGSNHSRDGYSEVSAQSAVDVYNGKTFPASLTCGSFPCTASNPRNWTGTSQTIDLNCPNCPQQNQVSTWGGPSVSRSCESSQWTATANSCTRTTLTCPSGYSLSGESCSPNPPQQLTDVSASDLIKLSDPPWKDFTEDLARDPEGGIDTEEAGPATPEVRLPENSPDTLTPTPEGSAIMSPKRVTDNGDGTRTEEQTKVTTKTEGDTITYNIQNTTRIINNTTNQTVSTSTEENDGADLSGSYNDTALPDPELLVEMPDVPDFYEQKYPQGFQGEWDQFKTAIDQTSFYQLIDQLTPDWSGGECPSWTVNFDLGFANYGSQVIAPPCWVFPFVKVILIVTALFVARGLVFGG